MTISEIALLDTNVLVYAADEMSPFHLSSRALRDRGLKGEESLCILPQIMSEFYAIVTDSKRVSNPRSQEDAVTEIEKYLDAKHVLKFFPGPEVIDIMMELLKRYAIRKQEVFDAQLVASMLSINVTRIYTFNRGHFTRFAEIQVLRP
jgi:uncharacterized protein